MRTGRVFKGNGPRTGLLTNSGKAAFNAELASLKALMEGLNGSGPAAGS